MGESMDGKFRICITMGVIVALVAWAAYSVFFKGNEFKLGLDLAGGTQLTYTADTSKIPKEEISGRVDALREVIENRVNALGVSEPRVYTTTSSLLTGLPQAHRLVVELPGVVDAEEAVRKIGETPLLEFFLFNKDTQRYETTKLNGGHVTGATVQFHQGPTGSFTSEPLVLLQFDAEGRSLFGDLTKENVGEIMGIFLDGVPISTPVIQTAILGGVTQITGSFTVQEAQILADGLNFGALPLAIELSETKTVDPTLGRETFNKSTLAGSFGLVAVFLFLIIVYRVAGILAGISLIIYLVILLALFKSVPVVLTAASLAGVVLSIGFAVDANVLIFERMREELKEGKSFRDSLEAGFRRAWLSIRDANLSSLVIAVLLFWFGTSLVKGFALTFGLGVVLSMITVYLVSKTLLVILSYFVPERPSKLVIKYDQ